MDYIPLVSIASVGCRKASAAPPWGDGSSASDVLHYFFGSDVRLVAHHAGCSDDTSHRGVFLCDTTPSSSPPINPPHLAVLRAALGASFAVDVHSALNDGAKVRFSDVVVLDAPSDALTGGGALMRCTRVLRTLLYYQHCGGDGRDEGDDDEGAVAPAHKYRIPQQRIVVRCDRLNVFRRLVGLRDELKSEFDSASMIGRHGCDACTAPDAGRLLQPHHRTPPSVEQLLPTLWVVYCDPVDAPSFSCLWALLADALPTVHYASAPCAAQLLSMDLQMGIVAKDRATKTLVVRILAGTVRRRVGLADPKESADGTADQPEAPQETHGLASPSLQVVEWNLRIRFTATHTASKAMVGIISSAHGLKPVSRETAEDGGVDAKSGGNDDALRQLSVVDGDKRVFRPGDIIVIRLSKYWPSYVERSQHEQSVHVGDLIGTPIHRVVSAPGANSGRSGTTSSVASAICSVAFFSIALDEAAQTRLSSRGWAIPVVGTTVPVMFGAVPCVPYQFTFAGCNVHADGGAMELEFCAVHIRLPQFFGKPVAVSIFGQVWPIVAAFSLDDVRWHVLRASMALTAEEALRAIGVAHRTVTALSRTLANDFVVAQGYAGSLVDLSLLTLSSVVAFRDPTTTAPCALRDVCQLLSIRCQWVGKHVMMTSVCCLDLLLLRPAALPGVVEGRRVAYSQAAAAFVKLCLDSLSPGIHLATQSRRIATPPIRPPAFRNFICCLCNGCPWFLQTPSPSRSAVAAARGIAWLLSSPGLLARHGPMIFMALTDALVIWYPAEGPMIKRLMVLLSLQLTPAPCTLPNPSRVQNVASSRDGSAAAVPWHAALGVEAVRVLMDNVPTLPVALVLRILCSCEASVAATMPPLHLSHEMCSRYLSWQQTCTSWSNLEAMVRLHPPSAAASVTTVTVSMPNAMYSLFLWDVLLHVFRKSPWSAGTVTAIVRTMLF